MGSMIITTGLYAWVRSFSDMYSSIAEGFLSYFLRHSISEIGYFEQIFQLWHQATIDWNSEN